MSDPIPIDDVPDDIGRNDPCPCESGKKYKKCCFRIHRVQKEAKKRSPEVQDLVDGTTTPWDYFKLLRQVYDNNMVNVFWKMGHDQGPFRETYDTVEKFIEAISARERLPAADGFDLLRIRHDGPDVYLLMARGHDDPKRKEVDYEVVRLRPAELDEDRRFQDVEHEGFRVWGIDRHSRPKSDLDDHDLSLHDFGYEWAEEWTEGD